MVRVSGVAGEPDVVASARGASARIDDLGFSSSGCATFPAYETPPGVPTSRYGFENPRGNPGWFEIWTWQHSQHNVEWPIKPSVAAALRGLRLSLGLSQVRLASALHVARVTVERWEKGTVRPFRGDTHTLMTLVRPLVCDQRSRGQLLGLAAAVVCPTLTRPTAIYTTRELAAPLRNFRHDHRDLAPALIYALTCAEVLVALDETDDSPEAQYLPVVGAGAVDRRSASWEHRVLSVAARLTDRDRDLWCEVGDRFATSIDGGTGAQGSPAIEAESSVRVGQTGRKP